MSTLLWFVSVYSLLNMIRNTISGQLPDANGDCPGYGPGPDGYCNDQCVTLENFAIDGNWWAESPTEVDWSTLLDGSRDTGSGGMEWESTQNQCTNNAYRGGYYYKAGIFCDTFDTNEQSLLANGSPGDLDMDPTSWVPIRTSSMQDKGDIVNVYYAVDKVNMRICAAMDRIGQRGNSYMDMEFSQSFYDPDEPTTWPDPLETTCTEPQETKWKCRYPTRETGDIQLSFLIANDISQQEIRISQWDESAQRKGQGSGNWVDLLYVDLGALGLAATYYYLSPTGAFELATNEYYFNASSFRYICDEKPYNDDILAGGDGSCCTCEGTSNTGAFFEACVDFAALGIYSIDFKGLTIKARASSTGAYKDTSGVLYNIVSAPENFDEVANCNHTTTNCYINSINWQCNTTQTPFPTRQPTQTTANPTTFEPTANPVTPVPTSITLNPTTSPTQVSNPPTTTEPTVDTASPTTSQPSTGTPTLDTASPTQVTSEPTMTTSSPTFQTTSPTQTTYGPSASPTKKPSASPTVTRGCPGNPNFDLTTCPDVQGTGCSLQFNVSLNVCTLDRRFTRANIYQIEKNALLYVMESNPEFYICTLDDLRVEFYDVVYKDGPAQTASGLTPAGSTDCTACAESPANYKYIITIHVGLFCNPNCETLKKVRDAFIAETDSWKTQFVSQVIANSKTFDSVCGNGFDGAAIKYISVVYKNENGESEGVCTGDCGVTGTDGTDGADGTDGDGGSGNTDVAVRNKNFNGLSFGFVFGVLVYFFL